MNGYIYKVTNRVNNKVYIGQTRRSIEIRWKQHIKAAMLDKQNRPLQKAIRKYGVENFNIEPIEEIDVSRLNEREMFWIAKYDSFKSGYNATLGGEGTLHYIWTDSQYDEIKSMYLSGFTSTEISKKFNVNASTILEILHSMNVKLRGNPLNMNTIEKQQFIERYLQGETLNQLAREYNTDKMTVRRFLEKNNVAIRKKSLIKEVPELQNELIKDFTEGITLRDLEIKYKADARTLKHILVEHGININKKRGLRQTIKGSFILTDNQCLELIKMYNDKIKIKVIASHFNIDISTVYKCLQKYHVNCKRYNQSKSVQSLKVQG